MRGGNAYWTNWKTEWRNTAGWVIKKPPHQRYQGGRILHEKNMMVARPNDRFIIRISRRKDCSRQETYARKPLYCILQNFGITQETWIFPNGRKPAKIAIFKGTAIAADSHLQLIFSPYNLNGRVKHNYREGKYYSMIPRLDCRLLSIYTKGLNGKKSSVHSQFSGWS